MGMQTFGEFDRIFGVWHYSIWRQVYIMGLQL
jgi:hypothetical protein